jgi:NADPH-dependent 7-cyano-7-deazaguanine reductase QueF
LGYFSLILLSQRQVEIVAEDDAFAIYTNLLAAISQEQIQVAITHYRDRTNSIDDRSKLL